MQVWLKADVEVTVRAAGALKLQRPGPLDDSPSPRARSTEGFSFPEMTASYG